MRSLTEPITIEFYIKVSFTIRIIGKDHLRDSPESALVDHMFSFNSDKVPKAPYEILK